MVVNPSKPEGNRPVVGLAGFFGHGNYGDELFVSVFKEYLGDRFDLVVMADLLTKPHFSRPITEVVAEVDAIVVGGGDILQPWNLDPRYFSKHFLEKPVFVVGIGVPIRPSARFQEKEWLTKKYRAFLNHPNVRMVNARDQQSAQWISDRLAPAVGVTETPDIVCALTLPPAHPPTNEPVLGVVTRQRPGMEDDYSMINALAEQQRSRGWRIRHIILGTGIVGERDAADAVDVIGEKEIVRSECEDDLSRAIGGCTALVSMKFHGSVVATMYGVPSTVLIDTNKNKNFMKRIDRSDLVARFDDPGLCARFDPAPDSIDEKAVAMLRRKSVPTLQALRDGLSDALL